MKRIGIIDIGSNSIRLLLAEISSSGSLKIIDELKESVRLAADMIDGNKLNEERMVRAIETIRSFKTFCDAVNISEISAVATEAVRKSQNRNDFIQRIKAETEIDVKVLTGDEEAYYDYIGVVNSMYVDNSLIVDIGGSSAELAWVQNNKLIKFISLPFGAVNLTQKFDLEDMIISANEDKLKNYLVNTYSEISWLFETEFNSLIGIGGTVRNIGKIDRKNKRYALDIHHNYELNDLDVQAIYKAAKSKNLKQRKKIDGLTKERADIFIAPTCAILLLMNLLKISKLVVSGKGLREGLLYEYINSHFNPINDVLDYSITSVITSHNTNLLHAQNVYKITKILFSRLHPLHHLDISYSKIIKTAAMLHDIGLSIRYYDHHKHSFYMILNSEINGLSHKELIMSAYAAASHRNSDFDLNIFQFHSIINRMDLANVEKIGVMLKIAESLDKSMCGIVSDIDCIIAKENVTLLIYSNRNVDLEVNDAKKIAPYFSEIFDKELIIKTK